MKKSIILILTFFLQNLYSQNYRAIYKLDYKRDSLSSDFINMDMILEIQKDYTKFYFQKLLKIDSIIKARNKRMTFSIPLQQIVKRKAHTFENENFVNVEDKYYTFSSSDEMKWKISDSLKNYNTYKLQKAETFWAGRKWTAWFCQEIPISEGPYKFRGLPGLIIELKDSKNNFNYSLISIKKMDIDYDTKNVVETNLGDAPIKINLMQYQKLLLNTYNNPFSQFENMKNTDWSFLINGKEITTMEGLKEIIKDNQSDIRKHYNPIELDKAIKYPK